MEGNPFINARFPELNKIPEEEAECINVAIGSLNLEDFYQKQAEKTFKNKDFFNAMPQEWKDNPELIAEYIKNSSLFHNLIHQERQKRSRKETDGLLGEHVEANEGTLENGSPRRTESGYKLNVPYLKSKGIDASRVLFYRRTQPSEEAKPELYWTSDFDEVASGLRAEISRDKRESSVVLVLDLETLDKLGDGLIQDVNDDSGISVRTISHGGIEQKEALFSIKNPQFWAPR